MRIHLFLFAGLAAALYDTKSPVKTISDAEFNSKVKSGQEPWLLELFSPGCPHCVAFVGEYEKAAKALKGLVKVGATDDRAVMGALNPKGVPSVRLFLPGSTPQGIDYDGARKAEDLVEFVFRQMKKTAEKQMGGGGGGGKPKAGGKKSSGTKVIELTDNNVAEFTSDSNHAWFVEFFAPWCGHCQQLAPIWEQVGKRLEGKIKVAKVDATVNAQLASLYEIKGFPTLMMFPAGQRPTGSRANFDLYRGERTGDALVDYALKYFSEVKEFKQITSEAQFDEDCGTDTCLIAFLPHLLDAVKPRRVQLEQLTNALKSAGSNPLKYFWSQGGDQFDVEERLHLQFGFPAVIAINRDKKKYAVHRGRIENESISLFVQQLIAGRASLDPLPDFEFKKAKPWDGSEAPKKAEL